MTLDTAAQLLAIFRDGEPGDLEQSYLTVLAAGLDELGQGEPLTRWTATRQIRHRTDPGTRGQELHPVRVVRRAKRTTPIPAAPAY